MANVGGKNRILRDRFLGTALVVSLLALGLTVASSQSAIADPATDYKNAVLADHLAASSTVAPTPSNPCPGSSGGWTDSAGASISHVIVIMEENQDESKIDGTWGQTNVPQLYSLLQSCGKATNLHNTGQPSFINYAAATSGTVNGSGLSMDPHSVSSGFIQNQENIFHQLTAASSSWGEYDEGLPSACYNKDNYATYFAIRHVPTPFYSDLSTTCSSNDVPLGAASLATGNNFYNALYGGANPGANQPAFSLVIPNLCDDLHGYSGSLAPSCTNSSTPTKAQDTNKWLATWVPAIINSPNYQAGNTLVLITFDEGNVASGTNGATCWSSTSQTTTTGCWVSTAVISPYTGQINSAALMNHYDMLTSVEHLLHVDPTQLAWNTSTGHADGTSLITAFKL
jgi:hypothetical protein